VTAPAVAWRLATPDLSSAGLAQVTREVAASAERYDRSADIPWDGLEVAHAAGLLTATVDPRYGGPGLGSREVARILSALGEGDPSVALLVANTLGSHSSQAAHAWWPERTYAEALGRSEHGVTLINAVRAEPDLGAPARGGLPSTVAVRTGDGWEVTGAKAWATGGAALAYHVVYAVAVEDGGDPDRPRVGHVVVPADAPGIEWRHTWDHVGLRASNTHDVQYTSVRVPPGSFVEIPRRPDGTYVDPAANVDVGGLAYAAIYVGVARAARGAFVDFARTRVPSALGRPIATTERIQAIAGEIDAQIAQAETLLYGASLRIDAGESDLVAQLGVVKVQIVRSAVSAVQTAVAALGNGALTRHGPLERHLRDVLCARVHPPQEDTALLARGKEVLGS
jgi:alkylation response protein AidB-like acyl-CoA dehydrogenase